MTTVQETIARLRELEKENQALDAKLKAQQERIEQAHRTRKSHRGTP